MATPVTPTPTPDEPAPRRRRRGDAADEAHRSLTRPIANWQAKFAWTCASWGLVPAAGLPLGALGVVFGLLGWRRVRSRPEDLGIRHALGGVIVGGIELVVNAVATYCVFRGLHQIGLI
jgi:hypothetical protein